MKILCFSAVDNFKSLLIHMQLQRLHRTDEFVLPSDLLKRTNSAIDQSRIV